MGGERELPPGLRAEVAAVVMKGGLIVLDEAVATLPLTTVLPGPEESALAFDAEPSTDVGIEERDRPAPAGEESAEDVCLLVRPVTDSVLVFRFCQRVREIEGAEIAFFTVSDREATLKLEFRNPLSILDLLAAMPEVDDASPEEDVEADLPDFAMFRLDAAVRVTLRAT